jgi:Fungal fucose-specific lectin
MTRADEYARENLGGSNNSPDTSPEAVDGIVHTVIVPKTEGPIPLIVDSTQKEAIISDPYNEAPPTKSVDSTILGLKPRVFYISVITVIFILGAAIGGGLGGSIAHKHQVATSKNLSQTGTSTSHSGYISSQTTTTQALPLTTHLPSRVRQGSSLSSIDWGNGSDYQLRVYYQDDNGYIRESIFADGSWNNKSNQIVKAKLGTAIASMFYPYGGGTADTISVG